MDANKTAWPADRPERRKTADLVPYARNARTHSKEQVEQLAAAIKEWGWTSPVLIDEAGGIIAGHGRVMAAKKLRIKEIPVIVAAGWSEAQKRAYVLADNKLAENAGWDEELLRVEFGEIAALGFDLELTGFDPAAFALPGDDESAAAPGESSGGAGSLAERFGIPPFSVLNAREGWWQDRKRAWLALGIQSELGRGEGAHNAAPGGSPMVAGYTADGQRLVGLKNVGASNARGDGRGRAVENVAIVAGNGWGNGGPARRDAAFYAKKRAWEKANGRKISTTEFRQQYWDGAAHG